MKGVEVKFTVEQEMWLEMHFPDTSNADCAKFCGCSPRTIVRQARRMGLAKSCEFMLASRRRGQEMAALMNRGEGNKGKENLLKHGVKYRFQKGINCLQRLGAERERERSRKAHETRNATIKSERVRINWGFEQKTKLRLVRQPKQWVSYRNTMKRRGYIVERGSREIYYNEDTNRSAIVEQNAQAAGLIIKAL